MSKKYISKRKKSNKNQFLTKNPRAIFFCVAAVVVVLTVVIVSAAGNSRVKVDEQGGLYGVDISEHNGTVDLHKLKKSGQKFVMIRLGYYNKPDKQFWDNVKAAHKAKMYFGIYLYSYAETEREVRQEARFVLKTLTELGRYSKYFVLPVAYDVEDERLEYLGKERITEHINIFCESMRKNGYTPMVYANANWYNNYIDLPEIVSRGYKIWYAYYPRSGEKIEGRISIMGTSVKADIWQFAEGSSANGGLDKNVAYDIKSLTD